jgi:hypothetical protein
MSQHAVPRIFIEAKLPPKNQALQPFWWLHVVPLCHLGRCGSAEPCRRDFFGLLHFACWLPLHLFFHKSKVDALQLGFLVSISKLERLSPRPPSLAVDSVLYTSLAVLEDRLKQKRELLAKLKAKAESLPEEEGSTDEMSLVRAACPAGDWVTAGYHT